MGATSRFEDGNTDNAAAKISKLLHTMGFLSLAYKENENEELHLRERERLLVRPWEHVRAAPLQSAGPQLVLAARS